MSFLPVLQKFPFVRFLVPLIIGIALGFYGLGFRLCFFFLALATFLFLSNFFIERRNYSFSYRWIFGSGVSFFFCALGIALSTYKKEMVEITYTNNEEQLFLAEIIENPRERNSGIECLAEISLLDENGTIVQDSFKTIKVILYIQKDSLSKRLQYGNTLLVSCRFPARAKTLNPEEFDYEKYLRRKGISASLYIPHEKWNLLAVKEKFSLLNESKQIQLRLMSIFESYGIGGEEYAVLSALTLGNKEYLESDLRDAYATTGASHILAVSGLHVGVVFFVLNFLLSLLFRKNRFAALKMLILILSLWIYAFITGLSPSVIRASVMFSFVSAGVVLQRKSLIYNTVAASAFCMLLYNPFYLFDISFQLSYTAVLSIVFFQPHIYALIRFQNCLAGKTWSLFTVSVAAQLGTFPLTLYYFHQFPSYFWLSGFVVIPLSGIIIYLALTLFALSGIPVLATGIAFILNLILRIMNFFIRHIEEFPYALIPNISFESYDLLFTYIALLLFAFFLFSHRSSCALLFISCLLAYFSIDMIDKCRKMDRKIFAVYNIPGASAVNKMENGRNHLYYKGELPDIYKKITPFWIKNRAALPIVEAGSYFLAGTQRVLLLTDDSYKNYQADFTLPVDYIVLSNNVSYTVSELSGLFRFQMLIADSSNSGYQLDKWKKQCREMDIACHIVKEQGACLIFF